MTSVSHIFQVGMGNSDYLAAFFHVLLPMAFEVIFYCQRVLPKCFLSRYHRIFYRNAVIASSTVNEFILLV